MPRSNQALHRLWSRALIALIGVGLAGCGGSNDAAETLAETLAKEEDRYQMGAPIDDSSFALIIESDRSPSRIDCRAGQHSKRSSLGKA